MPKLKLQCFGHLMQRTDSLEKTLMLGTIEGTRRRGWQRMRWLECITDLMDVSLSILCILVMDREAWHAVVHGITKSQTWLSNWTELSWTIFSTPKIDPWVQVLSDSFIHYNFPISLSFNYISRLCWSLPRSIRRKDFLLLLGKNYLFLFYWSFSQLSSISRWSSKDNSMYSALKHNRKAGGKTDLQRHTWNGGWKPDHVGSFRNNEGFQCLF